MHLEVVHKLFLILYLPVPQTFWNRSLDGNVHYLLETGAVVDDDAMYYNDVNDVACTGPKL